MRVPCGRDVTATLPVHAMDCEYCAGYLERQRQEAAGWRERPGRAAGAAPPGPGRLARLLAGWGERRTGKDRRGAGGDRRGMIGERRL